MRLTDIPVANLAPAPWNSNEMDLAMLEKLRRSVATFGLVEPLVVRRSGEDRYEIIGGSHRFQVLRETGAKTAPCVVVEAEDAEAMLLGQALNHIEGEEDLVMRAESFRRILEDLSESDVLSMLPETSESLSELASLGSLTAEMYAESWQTRKKTRLKHFPFRVTREQLVVVEEAIRMAPGPSQAKSMNPNVRSNVLVQICEAFIESRRTGNPL